MVARTPAGLIQAVAVHKRYGHSPVRSTSACIHRGDLHTTPLCDIRIAYSDRIWFILNCSDSRFFALLAGFSCFKNSFAFCYQAYFSLSHLNSTPSIYTEHQYFLILIHITGPMIRNRGHAYRLPPCTPYFFQLFRRRVHPAKLLLYIRTSILYIIM